MFLRVLLPISIFCAYLFAPITCIEIFPQNINYAQIFNVLMKLPNNECKNNFLKLYQGLTTYEEWAVQMFDASAKPQAGILLGNIMHVGNYDECIEIDNVIKGKYCTSFFQPHPKHGGNVQLSFDAILGNTSKNDKDDILNRAVFSYGFCVPKSCSSKDLNTVASILEDEVKSPLHFEFTDDFCHTSDRKPFTTAAIIAIVIFSAFGFVIVCSTLYDVFCQEETSNLLRAFSIVANGRKLLATNPTEGSLGCLNGLRVISLMWIILAHGFQFSFYKPHINAIKILTWKDDTANAFIAGSSMAVDTFFTVSALLVVYLFMKNTSKGVKFSLPMYYLHRILRLMPSLIMVVLFTSTLITYIGEGPFWPAVYEVFQKPCEKNWWSTLIFLQNYLHVDSQCVGQAWYLAVETQMYFLSPLVLLPLIRWPKQTIGAIILIVVLICSYVFEITYKYHLGTTFFTPENLQYAMLYNPTHVRGAVYLVGMIGGYVVYRTKTDRPLKLTTPKILALWVLTLLAMLAIVLVHYPLMSAESYAPLESSFFNALTRVSWSCALLILIVLCVNGYGGPINSFLSNSVFTVLIRLNYNIYLLHLAVMAAVIAQSRTPSHFSNLFAFYHFWGDYIFSIAAALVWTLAFESPVFIIEKVIFGQRKKPNLLEVHRNGLKSNIYSETVIDGFDQKISIS